MVRRTSWKEWVSGDVVGDRGVSTEGKEKNKYNAGVVLRRLPMVMYRSLLSSLSLSRLVDHNYVSGAPVFSPACGVAKQSKPHGHIFTIVELEPRYSSRPVAFLNGIERGKGSFIQATSSQ